MSTHVQQTIADVQGQIEQMEMDLCDQKKMVNSLRELINLDPIYHDVGPSQARFGTIHSDQFYGQPLATVTRQVLEMRKSAMTVSDIYSMMQEGGFQFDHKNDANAKRSLRISMSKNNVTFHKLPNGTYGLLEWYPNAKNGIKTKGDEKPEGDPVEIIQEEFAEQPDVDEFKSEEPTEDDKLRKEEAVSNKG